MNTYTTPSYSLAELSVLADLPVRTVRYYIQIGLVDRPEGETRAARYAVRHLEQLLLVKKWTAAGLALERIRALLQGETPAVPERQRAPGAVSVCSHVWLTDGLEVVIDPSRAGLSTEQVRQLVGAIQAAWAQLQGQDDE